MIESIDDSDLRDLKWKRILGGFLVHAKKRIVAWLQERERLESKKEVELLRKELNELAEATEIRWVKVYEPIPLRVLVFDLVLLSDAFVPLHQQDKVEFGTEKELLSVNTSFIAGDSAVDDLVTEKVDHSRRETIMRVKKPDYLGRSMWDLRADGHSVRAKILDERWLERFQNRQVLVRPGDSLRVVADRRTGYDDEGEVLFDHYEVIEVREVIQQQRGNQTKLFDSTPGEQG